MQSSQTNPMQTWKLTLAYDGTPYHGWQVQPGLETVQGELQEALGRITGERPLPQGSGRTDAGVHALAQTASFALSAPIPPPNLVKALNRTLPPSIRILDAQHAAPDFHARHSATGKMYEYRICRSRICPPFLAPYVYAVPGPLHFDSMQEASARVVGEHDFTSFAASDPDLSVREKEEDAEERSALRTVHTSQWLQQEELWIYRVHGSGFLHHMVRNLVGTFLECGRGLYPATRIEEILAARSRAAAGATAPARGLFLVSVDY